MWKISIINSFLRVFSALPRKKFFQVAFLYAEKFFMFLCCKKENFKQWNAKLNLLFLTRSAFYQKHQLYVCVYVRQTSEHKFVMWIFLQFASWISKTYFNALYAPVVPCKALTWLISRSRFNSVHWHWKIFFYYKFEGSKAAINNL
jgi:hypothetical protein